MSAQNPGMDSETTDRKIDAEPIKPFLPVLLNPMARVVCSKDIFYVGRTEQLEQMARLMKDNWLVFVTGVRGGGKTTFVNTFVSCNLKDFSHVLYVSVRAGRVTESVIQAFMEAKMINPRESDDHLTITDMLMQLIDSLLNKNFDRPLMIIDSANLEPSLKLFIYEWNKYHLNWKIIITTSLSEIEFNDAVKLKLPELDEISAMKLFEKFVSRKVSTGFKQDLLKIFHQFKFNPILCELLSKLIQSNSRIDSEHLHDLKTLLERKAEQPSLISPDLASRFESNEEMTIVEYISYMFDDLASTLSENEKAILRYLSILPSSPMDDEKLLHLLPISILDLEIIDGLVRKGWLLRGGQNTVYCHELYQLAIRHLLKTDVVISEPMTDKMKTVDI